MKIPNAVNHLNQRSLNKDFLILGKGPSFKFLNEINPDKYITIGINHVCELVKVNYAHIIDIEVIEHIGEILYKNCEYLIMPFVPHIRSGFRINNKVIFWPSAITLVRWIEKIPILNKLHEEGRLLSYDLSSVNYLKYSNEVCVQVQTFSAATIVALLAKSTVKKIFMLGVDGGNQYNLNFNKYKNQTRLQTGQLDYNVQFEEIAKLKYANDLIISHLGRKRVNVILTSGDEIIYTLQKFIISLFTSYTVSFNSKVMIDHINIFIKDETIPQEDLSLCVSDLSEIEIVTGLTIYESLNSLNIKNYYKYQFHILEYLSSNKKINWVISNINNNKLRKSLGNQIDHEKIKSPFELSLKIIFLDYLNHQIDLKSFLAFLRDKLIFHISSKNRYIFDITINKNYNYFKLLTVYSTLRKRFINYGKI
ncbi:MAG: hypothetical protein IE931_08960 [Sphingobacteriales bacterium]|nr:hypothetical protein [Sphingobacteriales bacterium]